MWSSVYRARCLVVVKANSSQFDKFFQCNLAGSFLFVTPGAVSRKRLGNLTNFFTNQFILDSLKQIHHTYFQLSSHFKLTPECGQIKGE